MRDLVAVVVVLALVMLALRMATSLHWYNRAQRRRRHEIADRDQRIVAEIPVEEGLEFFTEDDAAFWWRDRPMPKAGIHGVRVLISGAPISTRRSRRFPPATDTAASTGGSLDEVERDRWDVEVELDGETVQIACGAIRQGVSQELARQIFDTIARDITARET